MKPAAGEGPGPEGSLVGVERLLAGAEADEARVVRRNVLRVWAAFRLRWWFPFLCTAILMGLYTTWKLVRPPEYRAMGLVQLGMYADLAGARQDGWAPARGAAFETHRRLLTSHAVVEDAIVRSGQPLAQGAARREQREEWLEDITIRPVPQTYLVAVEGRGRDPAQVVRNVNGLMDAFIPFTNEFLASPYRLEEERQRQKEAKILSQLERAREKQREIFEQAGNVQFTEKRTKLLQTQSELQGRLTSLRILRAGTAAKRERYLRLLEDAAKADVDVDRLAARLELPPNSQLRERQAALGDLEVRLEQLAVTAGAQGTPEQEELERKLGVERAKFRIELERAARANLESSTDHANTLASEEQKLRDLVEEIDDQLTTLERQEGQFSSVRREVEWYDRELEATRAALRQLQNRARGDQGGAVIVDRAEVPMEAEARFKAVTFLFMGMVCFGLGVILLVAWDHLDDTVSREEKVGHLGLPILGWVPSLDFRDVDELAHLQGSGWLSEACTLMRTNLTVSAGGLHKTAVLVTSGTPGDGKSLISVALATSLVGTGGRTLIVEADMRAPRVQQVLGVSHPRGLSDVLAEQATLQQVAQPTPIENLFVLPSGACPRTPADLLLRGQFSALLEEAVATYDHVVVDAPPAQPLADTSLMANSAAVCGVVHVVRLRSSRYREVARGLEQIERVGGRNLGLVLNDVPQAEFVGHDYYGKTIAAGEPMLESGDGELFVVGSLPAPLESEPAGPGVRLLVAVVVLLFLGISTGVVVAGIFRALPADLQASFDDAVGRTPEGQ